MPTTVQLLKGATDVSATSIDNIVFTHGRTKSTGNIPPNTLTVTLLRKSPTPSPSSWTVGEALTFKVTTTFTYDLFKGNVTDVSFDKDTITVTATSGKIAGLGRVNISYPAGSGVTTTAALNAYFGQVAAAGGALTTYSADGIANVLHDLPAITDSVALATINAVIQSEWNGNLVEWGNIVYAQGQNSRRPSTMGSSRKFLWSFNSFYFQYGWRFAKRVGDKINRCTATSAAPTSGGLSATYSETADVTSYGAYAVTRSTTLNDAQTLSDFARAEVKHNDDPRYGTQALTIELTKISDATRDTFFGYGYSGAYLETTTIDSALPTKWFIEGMRVTFQRNAIWADLYVSDYRLTVAGQRWSDVTSGVKWNTVNAALTWDDILFTDI